MQMISGLEESMDVISSVVVMILMLIGLVVASVFVVFQVQGEISHLASVTSALLTESAKHSDGFLGNALNYTGITEADIDGYVDKAYVEGPFLLLPLPSTHSRGELVRSRLAGLSGPLPRPPRGRGAGGHAGGPGEGHGRPPLRHLPGLIALRRRSPPFLLFRPSPPSPASPSHN